MSTRFDTRPTLTPPLRKGETYRDRFALPVEPEPVATTPTAPQPEARVSKKDFAALVGMSVRWVEQKIAAGMPCEYIEGRPRLKASEGESWLRANGHLTATQTRERPRAKA